MSIVVGTLTIDLKADTASFSRGMDKASQLSARTANDIKRSLEKVAAIGLSMGAAIATGTVAVVKSAVDAADEMGKLAASAGTTVETLSLLEYGAKLSGLQIDQLGVGLVQLSKAAFAAQNGNVQLERIFGHLGVTVADSNGHLRDSGEMMQQLSVKFAAMGDGAGKTAIATKLFGHSGAALIPFLNEYGEHLDAVNAAAKRFGLQITGNTAALAGEAKSNLATMREQFEGLGFAILSTTLPGLIKLSKQILQVAQDANLPDLARAFGEKVSEAVTFLGNSLEFAEKHAHALKIALEALAAVKVGTIVIPIIADLAGGKLATAGKGIDQATRNLLGMERALPALAKLSKAGAETAKTYYTVAKGGSVAEVASLGLSQGFGKVGAAMKALQGLSIASIFTSIATAIKGLTFSSVIGGLKGLVTVALDAGKALMLAALSNPWTAAAVAIAGLIALLYHFRDSTFSLKGQTYELRDVWKASWILMGEAVTKVGKLFKEFIAGAKKDLAELAAWFGGGWIANEFKKTFGEAIDWARGILGSLVPQFAIDALNEAKRRRLADANKPAADDTTVPPPDHHKPPPDTSGLGANKSDPYGEEIKKLDLAIAQQKAYLGALDATPAKIAAIAAEEKAEAVILEITNKLIDEGKLKRGQSMAAADQAAIKERAAREESLKALVDYGKGIVDQQRSTDLAIKQARALAEANLQGAAAIERVTVANAILALNQKGVDLGLDPSAMAGELEKLTAGLTAKANIDTVVGANKDLYNLQQELATRKMLTAATLDSIDAQRQADLMVKLSSLDQLIATTFNADALKQLEKKRQAMVDLAEAENAQADAQSALALRSPLDQYARETDELQHAVAALKALQGGTLTYGEQLQIAAKDQEDFNKATDATIELLLKEGSLGDGVTAFFLKMQEQAKTAAQTIFDVLNETFNKLSDNLTALIMAPNRWKRREVENQFASTFEDAGKTLLDSTIKQQTQKGLGALGQAFHINLGTEATKLGVRSNPMWVKWEGLGAGSESSGAAGSGAGANPIFNQVAKTLSPFFRAPNELAPIVGSVAAAASRGSSPGSAAAQQQSTAGGIFGVIGRLFGAKPAPASSGVLGGETLGLPTSMSPTGAIEGGSRQPGGATGIATNVLTSIGKLFGIQPKPASTQAWQLPPSAKSFLSSNELNDQYGSPSGAAASPSDANELGDLITPSTSPGEPTSSGSATAAIQSIPTLLRRTGQESPASAQPTIPPALFPPASTSPIASPTTPDSSNPLAPGSSGLSAGESTSDSGIPSASAAEPTIYSTVQKGQPSTLDKILAAGVQLASSIGGAFIKGAAGGGSSSDDSGTAADVGSDSSDSDSGQSNSTDDGVDFTEYAAAGGLIRGAGTSTSDSIPARLSHGEYVINAASTAKHLPMLHAINNGTAKFAFGGLVGYDDGGYVSPNAAYLPASSDFGAMSSASSQIASGSSSAARQSAGDTHHWTVNVPPGNPDPAQITAHIDRYMRTAAPKIAAMSVQAVRDQKLRRAPSAK